MATITITRGLDGLTSAFNQCSIEFTITTTVIPTVTITSLPFTATKISTNIGGLDTYLFDLTDILPSLMGFPPDDYLSLSLYRKALTISISGLAATTQTITTYLCFAVDKIAEFGAVVSDILTQGRRRTAYTYGSSIGLYFGGSNGNYTVNIGSTSETVALVNGYNKMSNIGLLAGKSGLLTIVGKDVEFQVVAIPAVYSLSETDFVKWIDADGNYNACDFRLISTSIDIKSSNKIANYQYTMSLMKSRSKDVTKEKTRTFRFQIIAANTDHYAQLITIAESPIVYWRNMILKVTDYDKTFAECKQNLKFSLTLEIEDYVASY
jgi:hypothetical protein